MLKLFLGNIGVQSAQYAAMSLLQIGLFRVGCKIIETIPRKEKTTKPVLQEQDALKL